MNIQSINSNMCTSNKLNFNGIVLENSARAVIDNLSKADKSKFNKISKRISNTQYWDLALSSVGAKTDSLVCSFVNKFNKNDVHNFYIVPISRNGSKVTIKSAVLNGEDIVKEIEFKNPNRAQAMVDMSNKFLETGNESDWNVPLIKKIDHWAKKVQFMDEAYLDMYGIPSKKAQVNLVNNSFIVKMKNFFGWN